MSLLSFLDRHAYLYSDKNPTKVFESQENFFQKVFLRSPRQSLGNKKGNNMYCVKCGVELSDSEKSCPLCGTKVICPEGMERGEKESPYPPHPGKITEGITKLGALFILSFIFAVPLIICLICDLNLNGELNWSGYVSLSLVFLYTVFVLPIWFKKPNPVIFVPIDFLAAGILLLYICIKTGGSWFLSFALPVAGVTALIVTSLVTLTRYTRGGAPFIYGGAIISLGLFAVLIEFLTCVAFGIEKMFRWSLYPAISLFLIGIFLIIVGICKPLRKSLRKKLFF